MQHHRNKLLIILQAVSMGKNWEKEEKRKHCILSMYRIPS